MIDVVKNPAASRVAWSAVEESLLPEAGFLRARRTLESWPEYSETPLLDERLLSAGSLLDQNELEKIPAPHDPDRPLPPFLRRPDGPGLR